MPVQILAQSSLGSGTDEFPTAERERKVPHNQNGPQRSTLVLRTVDLASILSALVPERLS